MDGTNGATGPDDASEAGLDLPSGGWFAADLHGVLAALGEREAMLARLAARHRAEAATKAPEAPDRPTPRVPDHAIVAVGGWRAPRRPGELLPYRARVLALAALLVLGLAGLTWQHWPARPALVLPISLEAGVVVT